jgi:glyoxylase-like metal-dependent hydrolase (beta-lactamase superfamily II)
MAATILALVGSLAVRANEVKLPANLSEVSFSKVSERIYVLHGLQAMPDPHNAGMISNTGVVLTETGVVVVDSGGSHAIGRLIVEKIKDLTDKPIIAVFNSHIHGDHWLGNSAIREAFPNVRIYAHNRAIQRLQDGEAENWRGIIDRMIGDKESARHSVLPDTVLEGGEVINFGATVLKVHHTGHAHTDSDIMVEAPGQRLLFTGDIVEYGRLVSSDVPRDFDAKGQIEAIRYILALPVDIYVPGHGETGGKRIPQTALRFLETLYASVKRHYDEGLADYQMKERVIADLSEFSGWFNFDQIGKMISFVYQQVEAADFQ